LTHDPVTAERRERFLTLLETGRNVEQAAADVGVNPSTVARWAARGRAGADAAAEGFAERFDAIRCGDGGRLTEDDVVRALEQAIRKGSVTAIRIWLDRFGEGAEPPAVPDEFDELKARRAQRAG
jgi:transposase